MAERGGTRVVAGVVVAILVVTLSGCGSESPRARSNSPKTVTPAAGGQPLFASKLSLISGKNVSTDRGRAVRGQSGIGKVLISSSTPGGVIDPSTKAIYFNAAELYGDRSPSSSPPTGTVMERVSIRKAASVGGPSTEVVSDAHSLAVRADGWLAYAKGNGPILQNVRYMTEVVVQAPTGEVTKWSNDPARYEVEAWAGSHLIVVRSPDGLELGGGDLLSFAGANQEQLLAQNAQFLALSPDGQQVLYSTLPDGASKGGMYITSVSGGSPVAVPLTTASGETTGVFAATWVGNEIVAMTSANQQDLQFFMIDGSSKQVVQRVAVDLSRATALLEPFISDDGSFGAIGTENVANQKSAASKAPNYVLVTCAKVSNQCEYETIKFTFPMQIMRLRQPSRPLLPEGKSSKTAQSPIPSEQQ